MNLTEYLHTVLAAIKEAGKSIRNAERHIPSKLVQNARYAARNPFRGIVGPHRHTAFVLGQRDTRPARKHMLIPRIMGRRVIDTNPIPARFEDKVRA